MSKIEGWRKWSPSRASAVHRDRDEGRQRERLVQGFRVAAEAPARAAARADQEAGADREAGEDQRRGAGGAAGDPEDVRPGRDRAGGDHEAAVTIGRFGFGFRFWRGFGFRFGREFFFGRQRFGFQRRFSGGSSSDSGAASVGVRFAGRFASGRGHRPVARMRDAAESRDRCRRRAGRRRSPRRPRRAPASRGACGAGSSELGVVWLGSWPGPGPSPRGDRIVHPAHARVSSLSGGKSCLRKL